MAVAICVICDFNCPTIAFSFIVDLVLARVVIWTSVVRKGVGLMVRTHTRRTTESNSGSVALCVEEKIGDGSFSFGERSLTLVQSVYH